MKRLLLTTRKMGYHIEYAPSNKESTMSLRRFSWLISMPLTGLLAASCTPESGPDYEEEPNTVDELKCPTCVLDACAGAPDFQGCGQSGGIMGDANTYYWCKGGKTVGEM